MKYIKRFLYLLYFLKQTDFKQLRKFIKYTQTKNRKSRLSIWTDMLRSVIVYNIAPKDYFCFRFFEQTPEEREEWAGSGYMYEYQLKMNPKSERDILENKLRFLVHFKEFVKREFASFNEIKDNRAKAEIFLNAPSGFYVLKGSHGQVGAEVEVVQIRRFEYESLLLYMSRKNFDMIEEFVIQHPDLMKLSPSGLNTIRIFTQLDKGEVKFLGARLRITVNSMVDNMAAGNLAAPVDIETGVVNDKAVYSDITREDKETHPVTGSAIVGFKVPYWSQTLDFIRKAALHSPGNRSVGWDIAITPSGPELIEGNHNWCRLLWQMPVKKGMKKVLETYL